MNKYVFTLVLLLSLASASAELGYEVKINNSPQDQDIDNVNVSFYSGDYQSDSTYVLKAVSSTGTVLETAPVEIGSYGEELNISCIKTTTEEVDNKTIKRDVCDQAGFDVENTFSTYLPYHPKGEKIILKKDDTEIDTYNISNRLKTNYCGDNRCDMGEDYHTCGSDCKELRSAKEQTDATGETTSNNPLKTFYNISACSPSSAPCQGKGVLATIQRLAPNEKRVSKTPTSRAAILARLPPSSSLTQVNTETRGRTRLGGSNGLSTNLEKLEDAIWRTNENSDSSNSRFVTEAKDVIEWGRNYYEKLSKVSIQEDGKTYYANVNPQRAEAGVNSGATSIYAISEGPGNLKLGLTTSVEESFDNTDELQQQIQQRNNAIKDIQTIDDYPKCRGQLLGLIGDRGIISKECRGTIFEEFVKAQKIYQDIENKRYNSVEDNVSYIEESLSENQPRGALYGQRYVSELRHKKEFLTGQCDTIVDAGNFYEGQYRRLDSERGYHLNRCNESVRFQNKTEVNFSNEPSHLLILSDEPDKYKKSIETLTEQAGVKDSLNIISVDHNGSYMKDGKECHAKSAASDTIVKDYKERVGAEHAFLIGDDCTTSTVFGDYSVIESGDILGLKHYFLSSYVGIGKEYDVQLDSKVSFNTCETFDISSVEEGETVRLGCESGKDKKAKTPSLLNPKTVQNGLPGLTENQKVYVAEAIT